MNNLKKAESCPMDCEECGFCEVIISGIGCEHTEVWCTKYNVIVGHAVDDLDYDENPIQRIVYREPYWR